MVDVFSASSAAITGLTMIVKNKAVKNKPRIKPSAS
jgi:hypothetical protein